MEKKIEKNKSKKQKNYIAIYAVIGVVWVGIAVAAIFYEQIKSMLSPPPPPPPAVEEPAPMPEPKAIKEPPPQPPAPEPAPPQPAQPAPAVEEKAATPPPAPPPPANSNSGRLLKAAAPVKEPEKPAPAKPIITQEEGIVVAEAPKFAAPVQQGGGGDLSMKDIETYIYHRRGTVKMCYEDELRRNQKLEGDIEVHFTVASDGTVANPGVKSYEFKFKRVVNCILKRVSEWKFPPTGGDEIEVQIPFKLTTGEFGEVKRD